MTSPEKSRLAFAVACMQMFWFSLVCCILMAITANASYSRWEHVSVQSVEGWRYDDVTVYVTQSADRLVVEHADSTRAIMELSEFVAIYDARGRDVTELVLDPTYIRPEPILPDPSEAPDTTRLLTDSDYRARSRVSIQGGGSFTRGEWFTNRRGGLTFQAAVRVQTSRRFYVGMVYTHQIMDPKGRYRIDTYYDWYTVLRKNYTQHEMYAVIGINSGPRSARQSYAYAELGAGAVSFKEDAYPGEVVESWANFGARAAAGIIQPIAQNTGLVFEVNGRLTGHWSDNSDETSLGQLFGASIGLVFMAGK